MSEITKTELEKRIGEYQSNIVALQGAIQALEDLIRFLDSIQDAMTTAQLKDVLGASEVEIVSK